jgi:hypothetical protein
MPDPARALLDAVRAGPQDRVLVVGGGSAELLCASIRRGCRSAMGCNLPPLHPAPADAVLAPRVRDAEEAIGIAGCARRALMGGRHGRLALRLAGQDAAAAARAVARRLAALGYDRIRCRSIGGAMLVTGHCIPAVAGAR